MFYLQNISFTKVLTYDDWNSYLHKNACIGLTLNGVKQALEITSHKGKCVIFLEAVDSPLHSFK